MQVKDIYSNLQYADFASYYTNDFNYVFNWQSTINYLINEKSAQLDVKSYKWKIFTAKTDNTNKEPLLNVNDWGFDGFDANANYVLQNDIEKQLAIAKEQFPSHLFTVENEKTILQYFYLLVAFLIVFEKPRVNNGVVAGPNRLVSSRSVSVGAVSESFEPSVGASGRGSSTTKDSFYQNSYGKQYYDFISDLSQSYKMQYAVFCK